MLVKYCINMDVTRMYIYNFIYYESMISEAARSKQTARAKNRSVHSPRLETIMMVEDVLSKAKVFGSKNRLWRALPKQVQYKTFTTILDYLQRSNKIAYDVDNSVIWTFADNAKLKRLLQEGTVLR